MASVEQVVGDAVKRHRLAAKWTHAELADAMVISGRRWTRQAVGDAEAGRRSFTANELLCLSTLFKVPVGSLFIAPEGTTIETGGGHTLGPRELAVAAPSLVACQDDDYVTITNESHTFISAQLDGDLADLSDALKAAQRALTATQSRLSQ